MIWGYHCFWKHPCRFIMFHHGSSVAGMDDQVTIPWSRWSDKPMWWPRQPEKSSLSGCWMDHNLSFLWLLFHKNVFLIEYRVVSCSSCCFCSVFFLRLIYSDFMAELRKKSPSGKLRSLFCCMHHTRATYMKRYGISASNMFPCSDLTRPHPKR